MNVAILVVEPRLLREEGDLLNQKHARASQGWRGSVLLLHEPHLSQFL